MFLSSLMAIAAVLIVGVISPGPSFIYVARNAVARSRLHGLVTALGTGTGAAIFSIMAMMGLQKFLDHIARHDRVWVCRRIDIARHWKQNHPFVRN